MNSDAYKELTVLLKENPVAMLYIASEAVSGLMRDKHGNLVKEEDADAIMSGADYVEHVARAVDAYPGFTKKVSKWREKHGVSGG